MVARLNRLRQLALGITLVPGFIALSGCALLPPPFQYPITDGFHHRLPQANTRIVVWGDSPSVTGTTTTWLQKRGLRIVERAKILQLFDEQRMTLPRFYRHLHKGENGEIGGHHGRGETTSVY